MQKHSESEFSEIQRTSSRTAAKMEFTTKFSIENDRLKPKIIYINTTVSTHTHKEKKKHIHREMHAHKLTTDINK